MRGYCQTGPISRRQRASQRRTSTFPFSRHTAIPQKKRKVVQALLYKTVMERTDEPWQYKSFQDLWEGNIEYHEQSSDSEILTAICVAYNSSPPVNKPHTSPLTPKQVRFIHRKNGKVSTRKSAVYDGRGISCNYRQSCIYIEIMRDAEIELETACTSPSTSSINAANARMIPTTTFTESSTTQSSICGYFSSSAFQGSSAPRPHQSMACSQIIDVDGKTDGSAMTVQSELLPSHKSEQSKLDSLKEMFPDIDGQQIQAAFTEAQCDIGSAVNKLLAAAGAGTDAANDCSDQEDWMWDSPLAASTIIKTDDAAESFRKFTAEAVKPFALDMQIEVDRGCDRFKHMLRRYKHPAFDITRPLCVEFKDELGVDAGGVTREFFHLLMERLKSQIGGALHLFEGQVGHMVPMHDYDILSGGMFVQAGRMILHSILNGCNGLPGLSPGVVAYLMTGKRDAAVEHVTISDIPDPVLQGKLTELLSCGEEQLLKFTNPDSPQDICDLLMSAGFPHLVITKERRHLAYECILLYEVVTKRIAALADLRKGLGEVKVCGVSVLSLLERYPELQERVFPLDKGVITARMIRCRMKYDQEGCSDPSCLQAQKFFEQYIDELDKGGADGQEDLRDLVQFWSGYPSLPSEPTTMMQVKCLGNKPTNVLAEASTCSVILSIPIVHEEYSVFREFMSKSVSYGKIGFGKI